MPTASPFFLGLSSVFSTMATSASFHGIVGLQNTSRYQIARKNYWHYDAFIATPEIGDICVNVFTFGANTASAKDRIYLLDTRTIITISSIIDDEGNSAYSLQLFANDVHVPPFFFLIHFLQIGLTTSS
jgi:hypothetical protein